MSQERLLSIALYLAAAFVLTYFEQRAADARPELVEGLTERQVGLICITLGLMWPITLTVEVLKLAVRLARWRAPGVNIPGQVVGWRCRYCGEETAPSDPSWERVDGGQPWRHRCRAPAAAEAVRAMRCLGCGEESDPRDGKLWSPDGPGWRHRCGGLGVWL